MAPWRRFATLVGCRPSEIRPVLLMLAYAFCLGLTWIFYESASGGLFLAQYGRDAIPYVYMASAVLSAASAYGYARLEKRLRLGVFFGGILVLMVVALLLLRAGLVLFDSRPVALVMRITQGVIVMLAELGFWALAGQLFDLRQSKRLFGLLTSGWALAGILGGASVSLVSRFLGVSNLLLVCSGTASLALLLLVPLLRCLPHVREAPVQAQRGQANDERFSFAVLLRSRYLVLIVSMHALVVFGNYFLQFAFYAEVGSRYANREAELASFLGGFLAVICIITIMVQTLLSGWALNRLGVQNALLVKPLVLGAGAGLLAVIGLAGGPRDVIYWLVVLTYLGNTVATYALQTPLLRILYQPLSAGQRRGVQALVEGMVGAGLVTFLVSGLLLVCTLLMQFTSGRVAWILVFVVAAWTVVVVALGRAYRGVLQSALAKRRLGPSALASRGGASRALLESWLESPQALEVMYALHVLEAEKEVITPPLLLRLLEHPAEAIRHEALSRIERSTLTSARSRVEQMIERDPAAGIRGMSLRVLVALGGSAVVERVRTFLHDPQPELRIGALTGLLRHGGIQGRVSAGECLLEWARSSRPEDRTWAAQVLGEVGDASFHERLLPLLRDPDLSVRLSALRAAARVAHPALCPALLTALAVPALHAPALDALAAIGPAVLPSLEAALDQEGHSSQERVLILRACRQIETLAGLAHRDYRAQGKECDLLVTLMRRDVGRVAWLLAAEEDVAEHDAEGLLRRALCLECQRLLEGILLLLACLSPAPVLRRAREHLESESTHLRALAIEVIDQLLPRELKPIVLPLVEEFSSQARLQRLCGYFPQEKLESAARFRLLLAEGDWLSAWTRSWILYQIGRACLRPLLDLVAPYLTHGDHLLRETACWAEASLKQEHGEAVRLHEMGDTP